MIDRIKDLYEDEEFLGPTGFDKAIIGYEENEMRLIYSVSKCLKILEREMDIIDALEYFTVNISGFKMGAKEPIYCWDNL
jgi:hypothetical protein